MTINELLSELNGKNQRLHYADISRICDYDNGYICDVITEIADNDTSIYYSDIISFISDNPESLAEVVSEGLYSAGHGQEYDLFRHGQAAEFMEIEHELYSNMEDMLLLFAVDYLKQVTSDHDAELSGSIVDVLEQIKAMDNNDRLDTIVDMLNEVTDPDADAFKPAQF